METEYRYSTLPPSPTIAQIHAHFGKLEMSAKLNLSSQKKVN